MTANGEPRTESAAMPSLFTPGGIARWQAHLNGSAVFAEAAAGWVGTLGLVASHVDAPSHTLVRVADGRCPQGRTAGVPERESWRIAFGLGVGLVWLYLEVLRLLSYLQGSRN